MLSCDYYTHNSSKLQRTAWVFCNCKYFHSPGMICDLKVKALLTVFLQHSNSSCLVYAATCTFGCDSCNLVKPSTSMLQGIGTCLNLTFLHCLGNSEAQLSAELSSDDLWSCAPKDGQERLSVLL